MPFFFLKIKISIFYTQNNIIHFRIKHKRIFVLYNRNYK